MVEKDELRLSTEERDAFVDALVARMRGEGAEFPIRPSELGPTDLEALVERAASRTGDADAAWTALGDALAADADRDSAVAAAVEAVRGTPPVEGEELWPDGGDPADRSDPTDRGVDWDALGSEVAEAVVADLTGGPVDHERTAIFKTRLQKGGRVSVPEPEIEALGVAPGDLLQVRLREVEGGE